MKTLWSWIGSFAIASMLTWTASAAQAEDAASKPATAPVETARAEAAKPVVPSAGAPGPFRRLAPGVMKSVDNAPQPAETVSRHDVVELLAVDPNYDFAKDIEFRRDIWSLDFHFKPVRIIQADVPQPSGQMQRKAIWYMVYSVTNTGEVMRPKQKPDGSHDIESVKDTNLTVKFVPSFLLVAENVNKSYPDRVIPAALSFGNKPGPIQLREDPNRRFYNTAEMAREIKPGETVWGVATWEDIDPKTNRFSVYVSGLTNAYVWTDEPGRFTATSPLGTGRRLAQKTLKLNFRRVGDAQEIKENQIRYGIPDAVDYEWVYR